MVAKCKVFLVSYFSEELEFHIFGISEFPDHLIIESTM